MVLRLNFSSQCCCLLMVLPCLGFSTVDTESKREAKILVPSYDQNNPQKIPEANETGKLGRAALFSEPRIFPFFDQFFSPPAPVVAPIGPVAIAGSYHSPYFGPYNHPSPKPDCALNGMYCLYDKGGYPLDKVNTIVDRFYDDVRFIYASLNRVPVSDLLYYDNRTHSYREGGHFVCESAVDYIRPGWARSIRGEWLAIVNTDHFPQTVRVEECKYVDRRCEFLPPCYKSTCVQRFSFQRLLAVDPLRPAGKPFVEVFEIPSACSCFVENFVYY